MEQTEMKEGLFWKRNLTHLEWLIEHWDMYEFHNGTENLKEEITGYTRDKRRYYSRAVEAYERFCRDLYNDPCQYELGVSEEEAGTIIVKNPDGYLVSYGGIFCPCGFLRERTVLGEKTIRNQLDIWKEKLAATIEQLEQESGEWKERHTVLAGVIERAAIQKNIWAWMYTLINMTGLLLLVYLAKVVFELRDQAVVWLYSIKLYGEKMQEHKIVIIVILLLGIIWGFQRTWRGIHAIYLAEKGVLAKKMLLRNQSLCNKLEAIKKQLLAQEYEYYFEGDEPVVLKPTENMLLESQFQKIHEQHFVFYDNQYQLVAGFKQVLLSAVWSGFVYVVVVGILGYFS